MASNITVIQSNDTSSKSERGRSDAPSTPPTWLKVLRDKAEKASGEGEFWRDFVESVRGVRSDV